MSPSLYTVNLYVTILPSSTSTGSFLCLQSAVVSDCFNGVTSIFGTLESAPDKTLSFTATIYFLNAKSNTFPFIIIANKIDLELEGKRVVTKEEAQAFADKYGLPLFETSAKSGQGVEEAFQTLIQKVYDRNKEKKNSNFEIQ